MICNKYLSPEVSCTQHRGQDLAAANEASLAFVMMWLLGSFDAAKKSSYLLQGEGSTAGSPHTAEPSFGQTLPGGSTRAST